MGRFAGVFVALMLGCAGTAHAQVPGGLTPIVGSGGCFLQAPGDFPGCSPLNVAALDSPMAIAFSPGGTDVYVGARDGQEAIFHYRRDPATGALSFAGCIADTAANGCAVSSGLGRVWSIAVASDGEQVYAASFQMSAVAILDRDAATGALTAHAPSCISDGAAVCGAGAPAGRTLTTPKSLVVSPDGNDVYVAGSEGLTVLDRAADGDLTQAGGATGCLDHDGATGNVCTDGRGITPLGLVSVAITPNGETVVSASGEQEPNFFGFGDAVQAYSRASGGTLSSVPEDTACAALADPECLATGLAAGTHAVAMAPDGATVYALAYQNDAIVPFAIPAKGELGLLPGACISHDPQPGCTASPPLDGAWAAAASPDGQHLYVSAFRSMVLRTFARGSGGTLSPVAAGGCLSGPGAPAGCVPAPAVRGVEVVAIPPDGRTVYSGATRAFAGGNDAGVAAHKRDLAAPGCADASASIGHNQTVTLALPCADADDPLSLSIVASSPNAALSTIDQAARTVNFAPLPGFSGRTTFTFQAAGGTLATRVATFTVDVAAAPVTPARPTVIGSTVRNRWAFGRRTTKILTLTVRNVPAGATVEVRCKGGKKKGCPFKRKTARPTRGAVNVRKLFKQKTTLKPGARIELRVTQPGAIGRYVAYRIRSGKIPKATSRCLPPGSRRPGACPR